jgi:hypothetical protein
MLDKGAGYCRKALTCDDRDPYAHWALGLAYMHKAMAVNTPAEQTAFPDPALRHFEQTVALDEAGKARRNIANLSTALGR